MVRPASVLLVVVLACPGAWGQDPPTTDGRPAAAEAFERGKRAFEADDYVTALEAFGEAQALSAHDVVRFNIGLCQERLGHFVEALASFRHSAESTQLDEATRADAAERARHVAGRVGHLTVPEPRGARVSIAGRQRCLAPCTIDLDPGSYEVRVDGDGTTHERSVRVESGQSVEVGPPAPDTRPTGRRERSPDRLRIGLPGWIGAGVAVLGAAGTVLFGLRATSLHRSYLEEPTQSRLDDGRTAVLLTNVSLVTAVVGAASFILDLFLFE